MERSGEGYMIEHQTLSRYSKLLFSFPKWNVVFAIGISLSLIFSYLSKINFTGIFIVSILYFYIISRFLKYALHFPRAVVFSFVLLVIGLVSWIGNGSFIVSSTTSLVLISLHFSSRIENGFGKSLILAGVYPLILIPFTYIDLHMYILLEMVGLISGTLYVIYLSKEKLHVLKPGRILRAFLMDWLFHDSDPFEKEILEHSIEVEGELKLLKSSSFSIFQSSFHPGPVRTLGGGKLVNEILEADKNVLYAHSFTTHSLNPSSNGDVSAIKDMFLSLAEDNGKNVGNMGDPVEVVGKYFTCICIPFENLIILIFQKNGYGPDDIPGYLNEKIKQHFGNMKEIMIVDAHNSEADHDRWKKEYEEDIMDIVSMIDIKGEAKPVRAGFSCTPYTSRSVCEGGIRVAILKSTRLTALVSIDANGMDGELRKRLADLKDETGMDLIVPMTTDNHSKMGVGSYGGHPAGYSREDAEMIEKIVKRTIEDARRKLKKTVFRYSRKKVRIRVMGEEVFREINSILTEKAPIYIAGFILASFIPVVLQGVVA